ncbi:MAG: hypothetical protein ACR2JV_00030 [Gaiellales bacterium]
MNMTCPHCHAAFTGDRRSTYCPDCRDTGAPWRVDEEALDRARAHLGIEVPVRVRRMKGKALRGRYHGIELTPDAPRDLEVIATMSDAEVNAMMFHKITAAVRLTPELASRALWHELTHAAQYERDPDRYLAEYHRESRTAKAIAKRTRTPYARVYKHISFETEAKANEGLHDDLFPLALENKRCELPHARHPLVVAARNGRVLLGPRFEEYRQRARADIAAARIRMRKRT